MAKPRVIITSDIGGSDPDDMESMAHALLYADELDIQGLISSPTGHGGREAHIHRALNAYTKDYAKLDSWSDYQSPESLKSVTYQGNVHVAPAKGWSHPTEASNAIIQAAHESSEPLWVLAWGGLTDVAQALHDDPSIAGNIRILSSNGWNGTQDPHSREYIYDNFKDVWWIESRSTHRGIYIDESGREGNSFDMSEAKGHGALGNYFYDARPYGVKMGDSWTLAYLTDGQPDGNPGADSWGGTFVQNGHGPNYWTDDPSSSAKIGPYKGAAHVREHQGEIYRDMYAHFDRAKAAAAGDTGEALLARDDVYSLDAGETLYFNTGRLDNNDLGDGRLRVVALDAISERGIDVAWDPNGEGTAIYHAAADFDGVDRINYRVVDPDGNTDTGTVVLKLDDLFA